MLVNAFHVEAKNKLTLIGVFSSSSELSNNQEKSIADKSSTQHKFKSKLSRDIKSSESLSKMRVHMLEMQNDNTNSLFSTKLWDVFAKLVDHFSQSCNACWRNALCEMTNKISVTSSCDRRLVFDWFNCTPNGHALCFSDVFAVKWYQSWKCNWST